MKSATILCLSLFGFIAVCSAATDYCSSSLCSGSSHIACGNSGAYSSACPSGTSMVTMTAALKAAIVQSHNEKRNIIAGGGLAGFSSAANMATMSWNEELAEVASYNVKTCTFAHDACRNTAEFKYSGQNLAKKWWSGGSYTDESIILGMIDSWWSEYANADMSDINKYPSYSSKTIGHFTVMARNTNIAVGCSAVRFPEDGWNSFTLACNYATTNMIGVPVYVVGTTGSQCTAGTNPLYTSLCSLSQKYDVNSFN